jgi:hypothetical protein
MLLFAVDKIGFVRTVRDGEKTRHADRIMGWVGIFATHKWHIRHHGNAPKVRSKTKVQSSLPIAKKDSRTSVPQKSRTILGGWPLGNYRQEWDEGRAVSLFIRL